MIRTALLVVMIGLLVAGCGTSEEVPLEEEPPPEPEDVVSAIGTVRYVDLEGGFYGIIVEEAHQGESRRYLPLNLTPPYREDGLHVRFRGVIVDSLATVQMWGRPLEIRDIAQVNF